VAAPVTEYSTVTDEKVDILLVDDQPAKLLSYESILEKLGENLIKAGSATEALEVLLKRNVAVILIDVCMPDLDGFQLALMIREHPRFQKTAIIFVSAIQVTDLDLLRGYELGGVDYLPVPVVPELLRAKVKVFAELHRKTRQLETLNGELEKRVAERTAELAEANAELERRVEERTREREAALAQVHEMQKLESLGQLTGGVAHDFNNLLTAVLGNLEMVKKYLPENPRILRLVDGAIQGAERGANLTKRMLAFARRQELRPEAVDLSDLIDNMTGILSSSLGPTIEITTDFHPDIQPIFVDPNQLSLALLNLAVNARDAMPSGGQITVTARPEIIVGDEIPGLEPGQYVCIGVRDVGCGMDDRTLGRATEPFFTTKDRNRGTGLGLSMVNGLVTQSGGAMRISSRLGVGTYVELWLPVSGGLEPEQKRPTPELRVGGARPFRILVVDDDAIVAASAAAMLEDLGHSAIEAASAREGLDIVRSDTEIDFIITDYRMPEMTGGQLATEIRRIAPGLPVIIASGYADSSDELFGLLRLDKPFRQQQLAALIETLTKSKEPRSLVSASIGALNLEMPRAKKEAATRKH
jgi:signal transduction histidine kinase